MLTILKYGKKTEIKNENLKVLIQIQKYFGTAIWLYRAGTRSNHFKLYRAAIRVFSGLFHINGNHNYSIIELYDDYLMTSMEVKDPELFEHFKTRMVTNLKKNLFAVRVMMLDMRRPTRMLKTCYLAEILKNLI